MNDARRFPRHRPPHFAKRSESTLPDERWPDLTSRDDRAITLDNEGRIVAVGPACAEVFGSSDRLMLGANIADYLNRPTVDTLTAGIESYTLLNTGGTEHMFRLESVGLRTDGATKRWIDLTGRRLMIGGAPRTVLTVRRICDPHLVSPHVARKLSRYGSLDRLSPVGILQLAPDGSCLFANDTWVELSGLDVDASLGFGWLGALHSDGNDKTPTQLRERLVDGREVSREFSLRSASGRLVRASLGTTTLLDENGSVSGLLLVVADVSDKHALLKQLREIAHTDSLTGLANRAACLEHLDRLLEPTPQATRISVLYLDLDNFKGVNDTLGHGHGDELLRAVAGRLRSAARPSDLVARLGGDEFVLLLPDTREDGAATLARRIVEMISRPFEVLGHEVRIGASVGIAVGRSHAVDPATLFGRADTALYASKRAGRSRYTFFTAEQEESQRARAALVHAVREAVEKMAFTVHYQPQVCFRNRRIVGFEALLRPDLDVLPAGTDTGELVEILETTALIGRVGRWVLEEACAQIAHWRGTCASLGDATVSVNVSARQLAQAGFVEEVARTLERYALPPRCLMLEVTESMFVSSTEEGVLAKLRTLGVGIALDDFGTGYSSLASLGRFPVDQLKIDRSFVATLGADGDAGAARKIVRSVISLAHSLDVQILAEGVEDQTALTFLAEQGCQIWQGHLCSAALAPEHVESLLEGETTPVDPDVADAEEMILEA